jgi:hypothetical protein
LSPRLRRRSEARKREVATCHLTWADRGKCCLPVPQVLPHYGNESERGFALLHGQEIYKRWSLPSQSTDHDSPSTTQGSPTATKSRLQEAQKLTLAISYSALLLQQRLVHPINPRQLVNMGRAGYDAPKVRDWRLFLLYWVSRRLTDNRSQLALVSPSPTTPRRRASKISPRNYSERWSSTRTLHSCVIDEDRVR